MNRSSTKRVGPRSAGQGGPHRDLYIIDDLDSIPAGELRSIVGGTGAWVKAIVRRKFRPSQVSPSYAVEMGRLVPARHVPKRMVKYFDALRSKLQAHNFSANFEATVPAIGPYSAAVMGMSRPDGDVHFVAHRVTRQVGHELVDDGDFRFMSWFTDGTTLMTGTETEVPPSRPGVDFAAVPSDDPDAVLKKHRERMRRRPIGVLSPPELFARVEAENREQVEDLLRRRIIRPATPAEVARIRMKMRV